MIGQNKVISHKKDFKVTKRKEEYKPNKIQENLYQIKREVVYDCTGQDNIFIVMWTLLLF